MTFEEFYAMIKDMLERDVVEKLFALLDPEVRDLDIDSDDLHIRIYSNLEKLLYENQKDNIEM